jgi:hypothetical protein
MSNIPVLLTNALLACETACTDISKLTTGISSSQTTWISTYGNRYWYEGLARKDWTEKKPVFIEKLTRVLQLLKSLDQPIKRIKLELEHKKLSMSNFVVISKLQQEKQVICNCILLELEEICDAVSSCTYDDPVNFKVDGKINKKHQTLTKALSDEIKDKIDSWFHQLSSISGMGYVVAKASADIKHQVLMHVETPEINTQASFSDQIKEYRIFQEQKVTEMTASEKWVTDQYAVLNKTASSSEMKFVHNELLICEIPIILVKTYIHKSCATLLEYVGYKLTRLLGTYVIVENALLFRMDAKLFGKEDSITKFHELWKEYMSTNNDERFVANEFNENHLVPTGPLVRKGPYFYAWLIPQTLINDLHNGGFSLKEWDLKLN